MLRIHNNVQTVASKHCVHGNSVIDVTASVLNDQVRRLKYGIIFLANTDNTKTIWIGKSNVTANSDPLSGGFPIVPGGSLMLPFSDLQNLYAISTAADQILTWIGM